MDKVLNFGIRHGRKLLIVAAALLHLLLFALVTFKLPQTTVTESEKADVFKMVDIQEYIPPPPEPEKPPPPPEETVTVPVQAPVAANIVETEKAVVETENADPPPPMVVAEEPIEFLPQHKISRIPVIPTEKILSRIKYPDLAAKQGIEAVVYLELYIDKTGKIRDIVVLKDPGFGFAEAAIKAMSDIVCQPAAANGETVAVKFRYPIRFTLTR